MRFVQFCYKNKLPRVGLQLQANGEIIDLNGIDSTFPKSLMDVIKGGQSSLNAAKEACTKACKLIPHKQVKFLPPIQNPDKIVCVGLNYKGHCNENQVPLPKEPIFFSKFSSSIIGPFDDIKYPIASDMVDWEVELAVVIGKEGYNIPISDAFNHVFGYTIAQDISARDWQKTLNGGQFLLGKSMDTFCPLGPAIVTKETITDIYNLNLKTKINDQIKQNSNTSDIIHKIDYLISRLSRCMTLLPGDIILTGTPSGVGAAQNPPAFLKPGDTITSEIDEIGTMQNKIIKF